MIDWKKVVVQLPKMSVIDVDKIQKISGDLNSHKEKAFDTWLRRYPEASWSHVRDALHKAGEYILEREVAEKYSLPLLAESIPMREVFSSQTNFTTDGTIGGHQPNIGPQFPVLLAPPPSKITEILTFFHRNILINVFFCIFLKLFFFLCFSYNYFSTFLITVQ